MKFYVKKKIHVLIEFCSIIIYSLIYRTFARLYQHFPNKKSSRSATRFNNDFFIHMKYRPRPHNPLRPGRKASDLPDCKVYLEEPLEAVVLMPS